MLYGAVRMERVSKANGPRLLANRVNQLNDKAGLGGEQKRNFIFQNKPTKRFRMKGMTFLGQEQTHSSCPDEPQVRFGISYLILKHTGKLNAPGLAWGVRGKEWVAERAPGLRNRFPAAMLSTENHPQPQVERCRLFDLPDRFR